MLFFRLSGGIGNQLFQFATARQLAQDNGLTLAGYFAPENTRSLRKGISGRSLSLKALFDTPNNNAEGGHRFQLSTSATDLIRAIYSDLQVQGARAVPNVVSSFFQIIREPQGSTGVFDATLSQRAARGGHMIGYWQSPKYFEQSQDYFRDSFSNQAPASQIEDDLIQLAEKEHPICVHVRRGDYANSATARNLYGLLSPEYFSSAIKHLSDRLGLDSVWVFSEDTEYCRQNIRIDSKLRIRYFGPRFGNLDDTTHLRIMSRGQAFVISNSTFSWWAAWGSGSDQVIRPHHWTIRDPERFKHIFPTNWQCLERGKA